MFNTKDKKKNSPMAMTMRMFDRFKQGDKNNNENEFRMSKALSPDDLNTINYTDNRKHNINILSQGDNNYMPSSQLLNYSLANNISYNKKNFGTLENSSQRIKKIIIEPSSEQYNSRVNSQDSNQINRKNNSTKLIVDNVTYHMPNSYYREKGQYIIPNKQYTIKTYTNLNPDDLNLINNINNNDDIYEYEKKEIIKIKKYNYLPIEQNNNRIEEKNVIFQNINNKDKDLYNNCIKYNNENIIKNNFMDMQKRENLSSYGSSDYKYPFVIRTKKGQNESYNRSVYNDKNKKIVFSKENNYIPQRNNIYNNYNDNINLTQNSEYIKQNEFDIPKKRLYENNEKYNKKPYNLKLYNNENINNMQDCQKNITFDNNNNNDTGLMNSLRYSIGKNKDSHFKALFIKKDKEYNILLDDYNDLITKYNQLQEKYNKKYNDEKTKDDNINAEENKFNLSNDNYRLRNDKSNINKLINNIKISPPKKVVKSKTENNILNNKIYEDELVNDSTQKNINSKEDYENKYKNFSSYLKVEQNNNIFIFNKNKKEDNISILKNESFDILRNNNNIILNKKDVITFNSYNNFCEEKNNRFQLDYKNRKFDENELDIRHKNEINLMPKIKNEKINKRENKINYIKSNFYFEIIKLKKGNLKIIKNDEINIKNNKNGIFNNNNKYFYNLTINSINSFNLLFKKIYKRKKVVCDSGTSPIEEINQIIINKGYEFEIKPLNIKDNKLGNNKKNELEIRKVNELVIISANIKDHKLKIGKIYELKYISSKNKEKKIEIGKIYELEIFSSKIKNNNLEIGKIELEIKTSKIQNKLEFEKENELEIISLKKKRKKLKISKANELEIIKENNNKKKNIFEIIDNVNLSISSNKNIIKSFKDLEKFKIIDNQKIFYYYQEDNNKKKLKSGLEINNINQFNIINIKENFRKKEINDSIYIENNSLYIPSAKIKFKKKEKIFNKNNLQKENSININLTKIQKKKLLESDNFNIFIKNHKNPSKLSINSTELLSYDIDLINKIKNRIDEFNKVSSINNIINLSLISKNNDNKDNIREEDRTKKYIINKFSSYYIPKKNKNINQNYEKINIDNIYYNYKKTDENKENKDSNSSSFKYSHIIDEINSDYSSKLNINNQLNKYNNKNPFLSKIKRSGLDIKINKLNNKNFSQNSSSSINNSLIISDIDKCEKGEKGEIIEQNIDRLLNQNKALYLQNLIYQKNEKEKEISKIFNNNESLVKFYFLKWKNADNNCLYRIKYLKKNKSKYKNLKNIFRKYVIKNWNKDIKDFIDKYMENFLGKKKINKRNKYYNFVKINNNLNTNIPDLDYIRNKLHVSIVKRIKMTEEEINKYNDCFNIISFVIKKHFYKYFLQYYKKE